MPALLHSVSKVRWPKCIASKRTSGISQGSKEGEINCPSHHLAITPGGEALFSELGNLFLPSVLPFSKWKCENNASNCITRHSCQNIPENSSHVWCQNEGCNVVSGQNRHCSPFQLPCFSTNYHKLTLTRAECRYILCGIMMAPITPTACSTAWLSHPLHEGTNKPSNTDTWSGFTVPYWNHKYYNSIKDQ